MLSTSSSETIPTIAMQHCLLMLLLCLSDVAVHGDFRFRREVNETVEPTSIGASRSCGWHAVVPIIVLQTRTSFKNNSVEIYELRFIYTVYNAKFFAEYSLQQEIFLYKIRCRNKFFF